MKIEREEGPSYRVIVGDNVITILLTGAVEWPDIKHLSIADAEELGSAIRVVGTAARQLAEGATHTLLDLWKHTIEHPAIDEAMP